jgi:regulator of protease activity HflC (stomatin/prohibitin superfamily)
MSDVAFHRAIPGQWSAARAWLERRRRGLMLMLLVLMFVVAALASRIFITIPAGHGGILWLRFFGGTQTQMGALGEGLHIIFPWDNVYIYDMRVQEHDQAYEVIAREGLQVSVRSSFRWQLNRMTLPRLHKEIGPNYVNVLLVPEVGSVLRERVSQYDIEELFSSRRSQIQREILQSVAAEIPGEAVNRIGTRATHHSADDFVTMTDILLKDVTLPFRLRSAIERKLEQAQISQEYGFRIEREKLESQRKKIEAQGIQAFQQTVQEGISEAYLKWRGIEATLQLATSPNSKVVIVGGGSQGLPLILNTDDSSAIRQPQIPAPQGAPADPAKLHNTEAENSGFTTGSIEPTPPGTNAPLEQYATPAEPAPPVGHMVQDGSDGADVPEQKSSTVANEELGSDTPYILRSFADAFGYRLQSKTAPAPIPAPAPIIGPNERPQ